MANPPGDDRLVPGARKGTVGVYDKPPAWRRWLPVIIAIALALVISAIIYFAVIG